MKRAPALLALILLIAFIAILIWKVPEPDLAAVALLTVGLAVADFVYSMRRR